MNPDHLSADMRRRIEAAMEDPRPEALSQAGEEAALKWARHTPLTIFEARDLVLSLGAEKSIELLERLAEPLGEPVPGLWDKFKALPIIQRISYLLKNAKGQ